ncbi:MAG: SDR family oxidoreductase [Clostridiales Family XIII bacterium]|jgi:NAD(P)-dependent dehydrogenase (short-subunit alcohol dehydrogenase family)|nr:SDR family oxidoreductase [Clostridiales Family XIII bacterium]
MNKMNEKDLLQIDGKIALITGAGSGIGEASAKLLADCGAVAIVLNTNEAKGLSVREQIRNAGGRSDHFRCDVGERSQVFETAHKILQKYARLDILVNNAGIMGDKADAEDLTEERWKRMLDVNLMGAVYFSQAFAGAMKARGTGKIVNVSSGGGVVGMPGLTHYSAAKAALIGFTKALAKEMAPHRINVNAIAAPLTVTDMIFSANYNNLEEETKTIPWGRPAYPDDVAKAVLYLVSDLSEYMTGQVLSPNGGRRM